MHYTKIEMAESMSTRMKISARRFLQLCGCSHESRYILRISSKAGLSKDLYSKVSKTCGIKISVLCRSGITFVDKMDQFIWRAQSVDKLYAVWSKLRIFCKAMHSTFTVFASAIEESIKGYATQNLWCGWAAIKGGGRPTRLLPHTKVLLVPIRFFPLLGRLCSGRFYIFTEQMWF